MHVECIIVKYEILAPRAPLTHLFTTSNEGPTRISVPKHGIRRSSCRHRISGNSTPLVAAYLPVKQEEFIMVNQAGACSGGDWE
jgi:hypothetical protein